MKKLLIAFAILVIIAVVAVVVVVLSHRGNNTGTQQNPSTQFPIASTTTGGTQTGVSQTTIPVKTISGGLITVNNFINNGVTIEDKQNPGNYYLAGSPDYCLVDGSCPSGAPLDSAIIVYRKETNSFIISLTKEPLGAARQSAEQYLGKVLGLTNQQLCNVYVYVSTTQDVNDTYAGQSLGMSFCPNAVRLPL